MPQIHLAIVGVAAVLAGCTGATVNPYYYGNFQPTEAYRVGLLTSGEPVAGTRPGVPLAVLTAMRGHTAFPTDFSLLPDGAYSVYRVVFMFNTPSGLSTYALCGYAPPPMGFAPAAPGPGGRLAYSAALCRGDQVLSSAYGYMDRVLPNDPRFSPQIAEVTRNLFPPNNPDWHPSHRSK
jgi:hypothetical protein